MTKDERREIVQKTAKIAGYWSLEHEKAIKEHMTPNEHGILKYKDDDLINSA